MDYDVDGGDDDFTNGFWRQCEAAHGDHRLKTGERFARRVDRARRNARAFERGCQQHGIRIEYRPPDPAANPYLAYTALLMAGLDGVINKIDPGEPLDKNIYELPPEELAKVPQVCGSLREALDSLKADHDFLKKGNVFSQDFIESYIDLKMEEVYAFEHTPHPIEFKMYYSV